MRRDGTGRDGSIPLLTVFVSESHKGWVEPTCEYSARCGTERSSENRADESVPPRLRRSCGAREACSHRFTLRTTLRTPSSHCIEGKEKSPSPIDRRGECGGDAQICRRPRRRRRHRRPLRLRPAPTTHLWPASTHLRGSSVFFPKDMEADKGGEQVDGSGPANWPASMSAFMLSQLSDIVASGTRTSTGFKMVHYNAVARAVNEKFSTKRTGEQVKNHLKTWQRRYAKICRLKKVSASGWDEDNCIITLDAEHYNDYIKDHKSDADFFNKPLENYAEMQTIYGNSMATGKYAKDSSCTLGTEETELDNDGDGNAEAVTLEDNGASSSATRPNKRARHVENNEDTEGLIGAFTSAGERLAKAIEKCATGNMDLPPDLITQVQDLPGFDETHKSFYYAHLVENPHVGRAFYNAPFEYKLNFIAKWIGEQFPG